MLLYHLHCKDMLISIPGKAEFSYFCQGISLHLLVYNLLSEQASLYVYGLLF